MTWWPLNVCSLSITVLLLSPAKWTLAVKLSRIVSPLYLNKSLGFIGSVYGFSDDWGKEGNGFGMVDVDQALSLKCLRGPVLCYDELSYSFQHWHSKWLHMIQLPASIPEKAVEDDPSLLAPVPLWETWEKLLTPDISLTQFQLS